MRLGLLAVGVAAVHLATLGCTGERNSPTKTRATWLPAETITGVDVAVVKGSLVLTRLDARRRLAAGADVAIEKGDSLETTADEGAQLMLSHVASVTMSPATRISQVGSRDGDVEHITVSKGQAHLWVSKRQGGHALHVVTPDLDVQVYGAEFVVGLGSASADRTCVRVREGTVLVFRGGLGQRLEAGQSWGCRNRI